MNEVFVKQLKELFAMADDHQKAMMKLDGVPMDVKTMRETWAKFYMELHDKVIVVSKAMPSFIYTNEDQKRMKGLNEKITTTKSSATSYKKHLKEGTLTPEIAFQLMRDWSIEEVEAEQERLLTIFELANKNVHPFTYVLNMKRHPQLREKYEKKKAGEE